MNRSNIEWTEFTSNPIRGKCLHGCEYCYAERIRKRFGQPEELSFHPNELRSIENRKKPATIFMGSMYDIFGSWVPSELIRDILRTTYRCPRHTFIFLTKNPARYEEFAFSKNCWIGYSDDGTQDIRNWVHFKNKKNTFVSFEPLIGKTVNVNMAVVDATIIGAMTGPGAIPPDIHIVDGIISAAGRKPMFFKNNLLALFPPLRKIQETAWRCEK